MRPDHPELLTTLRDVAATAVTLLDALAQIRRERTPAPPPTTTATPAPPDDPDDQPDAPADFDDAPDPILATPPRPTDAAQVFSEAISQQFHEGSLRLLAREKLLLQQRAAAHERAASIRQRLLEIADLTSAAVEGDGAQTLLLLDARLGQLLVDVRDQHGPFAAVRETDPS